MSKSQFISEAEWATWMPVPSAVTALKGAMRDIEAAKEEIWTRLQAGRLQAVAQSSDWHQGHLVDTRAFERIFPMVFKSLDEPRYDSRFWKIGSLEFFLYDETSRSKELTKAFGVRFEPQGIESMLADAGGILPKSSQQPNEMQPIKPLAARRGARRKDWWDHLWIEMFRRIQAGTLKPSTQSELQEILETYVDDKLGGKFGDSTLKPMASNLFKFLEELGGK